MKIEQKKNIRNWEWETFGGQEDIKMVLERRIGYKDATYRKENRI